MKRSRHVGDRCPLSIAHDWPDAEPTVRTVPQAKNPAFERHSGISVTIDVLIEFMLAIVTVVGGIAMLILLATINLIYRIIEWYPRGHRISDEQLKSN